MGDKSLGSEMGVWLIMFCSTKALTGTVTEAQIFGLVWRFAAALASSLALAASFLSYRRFATETSLADSVSDDTHEIASSDSSSLSGGSYVMCAPSLVLFVTVPLCQP